MRSCIPAIAAEFICGAVDGKDSTCNGCTRSSGVLIELPRSPRAEGPISWAACTDRAVPGQRTFQASEPGLGCCASRCWSAGLPPRPGLVHGIGHLLVRPLRCRADRGSCQAASAAFREASRIQKLLRSGPGCSAAVRSRGPVVRLTMWGRHQREPEPPRWPQSRPLDIRKAHENEPRPLCSSHHGRR